MTGVTYLREKPDLILMHDDSTIAVLDKEKDMPEPSAKVNIIPSYPQIFVIVKLFSWSTTIRDLRPLTISPKMVHPTVQASVPALPKMF